MKLRFFNIFTILITFLLISCGSTPKAENSKTFNSDNFKSDTEDLVVISDDVDVIELNEEVINTFSDHNDEEYLRSTVNLTDDEQISQQEFYDDKAAIMKSIDDLQLIMTKKDFNAWLKYIEPESIKYYSNPVNVRKAQKKLPYKTIQLNGIEDYFVHVFISARKRAEVKEIRYISKTETKAVDIKDDGSIVVYYQFIKKNDKWLVRIPPL